MILKLTVQNIVIIANNFNPSILREQWLVEHGILKSGEMIGNFAFSNQAVNFFTKDFGLTALSTQIQLQLLGNNPTEIINETLGGILRELPHVPYQGIGINFNWELHSSNQESYQELSKKLFYSSSSPVFSTLDSDDSFYGAYVSKNFHLGRMKLDMKPSKRQVLPNGKSEEFINFSFNYHHEVTSNPSSENIIEIINDWILYLEDSKNVMNKIVNGSN